MQVLLRKDVDRLGRIGEIVAVKSGYARNYLIPQGLAAAPTPGNIRRVEIEQKKNEEAERLREQDRAALAESLKSASITVTAKANEEGHLFGSITTAQIAEMLQAEGYKVDEKMVQLTEPIKELGVIEVPIQIKPELISSCKVWVVAE